MRLNNCPLDRILCFTGNEKLRTKDEKCTLKDYVFNPHIFKTTPTFISKSNTDDPCPPVNSLCSHALVIIGHTCSVDLQGAVIEYRHIFIKSLLSWLPFSW